MFCNNEVLYIFNRELYCLHTVCPALKNDTAVLVGSLIPRSARHVGEKTYSMSEVQSWKSAGISACKWPHAGFENAALSDM